VALENEETGTWPVTKYGVLVVGLRCTATGSALAACSRSTATPARFCAVAGAAERRPEAAAAITAAIQWRIKRTVARFRAVYNRKID
jgi:hypothetical protein